MFSEFNVRAEVRRIETSNVGPVGRAKALLRLAKRVETAAGRLALLSRHHYRKDDPLLGARFREAMQRLCGIHEELRSQAGRSLRPTPNPHGLDAAPPSEGRSWRNAVAGGRR